MNQEINVLNKEFIQKTENILKNKCFGSKTLFKKDLAKELGFNHIDPKNLSLGLNVISIMFDLGYFKDYKIIPGKHGGIVHTSSFYKDSSQVFPVDFLEKLFENLNSMCNHRAISRTEIAKNMTFNLPQKNIIGLITLALQKKYITGFSSKAGKNGGIIRNKSEEPKLRLTIGLDASLCEAGLSPDATLPLPAKDFWATLRDEQEAHSSLPSATNG